MLNLQIRRTRRDMPLMRFSSIRGYLAGSVKKNVSFQSELPAHGEPVLHHSVSGGSFDWKLTFYGNLELAGTGRLRGVLLADLATTSALPIRHQSGCFDSRGHGHPLATRENSDRRPWTRGVDSGAFVSGDWNPRVHRITADALNSGAGLRTDNDQRPNIAKTSSRYRCWSGLKNLSRYAIPLASFAYTDGTLG